MKRLGRTRECDARYLSGRPSFTISSWGETRGLAHEKLTEIGHGDRALGHHNHNRRSKFYASEVTGERSDRGAASNFKDATTVYASDELPLLAHVWPTISADQLDRYDRIARRSMSPALVTLSRNDRRESTDQYAAGGSKFRMSTAGIGVNIHVPIDVASLVPADRKRYEQAVRDARRNESRRAKPRWDRSPHVTVYRSPKLSDEADHTPDQSSRIRIKSAKKRAKSAYGGSPFKITKPHVVDTQRYTRRQPTQPKGIYIPDHLVTKGHPSPPERETSRQRPIVSQSSILEEPVLEEPEYGDDEPPERPQSEEPVPFA